MFYLSIPDDAYVAEFIQSRRHSARKWDTRPSATLAVIERFARCVRAGSARIERWAQGSEGTAPDAMPLPLPR